MRRGNPKRERGAALLALLAVIMLGASWLLVSRLNAESGLAQAAYKSRNAEVLKRAKTALIGYVAAQAAKSGEKRPGAFPCPEAAADFNNSANEGTISYPCTLPKVGRFPWKSLGLNKLVDASGEPLWYVVASGWAGANTVINSNCASPGSGMACATGRLSVDGVTDDVIALIIAPGPALSVAASGSNCAAKNQVHPTSGTPDWSNYLECENATYPTPDATFATTGPSGSFNDQVVKITVTDILPAIEAAIASRIEREIAPLLSGAYTAPNWSLTGTDMLYPYAAPFSNPDIASFTGTATNNPGLLPLVHAETFPGSGVACTAGAADPRCDPTIVQWANASPLIAYTGIGVTLLSSCSYASSTGTGTCAGTYVGTPAQITVSGLQGGGAVSLRQVRSGVTASITWNDTLNGGSVSTFTISPSLQLNGDGTLTVSVTVPPPAPLGVAAVSYSISIPGNATADHDLLDTRSSGASTSWFVRNEWHKLLYYAFASGYAASSAAPRACATGVSCLSVGNLTPVGAQRAILILAGRSINGSSRPSSALADYFEFGNANGTFERQTITSSIATMNSDTGTANAYVVAASILGTGAVLQFKATNANTGTSTLTTPATGSRSLVNSDGTNLSTSTIQANAAVQVIWDGTQFQLSKRPFNDRVVTISSN